MRPIQIYGNRCNKYDTIFPLALLITSVAVSTLVFASAPEYCGAPEADSSVIHQCNTGDPPDCPCSGTRVTNYTYRCHDSCDHFWQVCKPDSTSGTIQRKTQITEQCSGNGRFSTTTCKPGACFGTILIEFDQYGPVRTRCKCELWP